MATILKNNEDYPEATGVQGALLLLSTRAIFMVYGLCWQPKKSVRNIKRWKILFNRRYGSIDKDGYFYFSTRDDDVIIMAGYRIGPFEVESALSTHSAVAECAVIATPDKVRGEVIEAFVVLMPGINKDQDLTEDLQKWVKKNFAAHAYPRHITYVKDLPKTPSGKDSTLCAESNAKMRFQGMKIMDKMHDSNLDQVIVNLYASEPQKKFSPRCGRC